MGLPVGLGNAQVIIHASADKYHVPAWILWGVFGVETGFGKNVKDSSAGAKGPFQFMPATAKAYDYPLTNSPNVNEFQKQADAAAHYLSDLKKKYGTWELALRHYSGDGAPNHGYGVAAVKKANAGTPHTGGVVGAVGGAGNAIGSGESTVANAAGDAVSGTFDGIKAIGAFFAALLEHDTWTRVLKVGGGGLLLWMALHEMGMAPNAAKTLANANPAARGFKAL